MGQGEKKGTYSIQPNSPKKYLLDSNDPMFGLKYFDQRRFERLNRKFTFIHHWTY